MVDSELLALRKTMSFYYPIGDRTWDMFKEITSFKQLPKKSTLYFAGEVPVSYGYVYQGLIRAFVTDEKGNEYNKKFFDEGKFPGSMTSLLTSTPSNLSFEAVEDSLIIEINFLAYRKLMLSCEDLKLFQIYYLEKNWLLDKDAREIEIVQEDATTRYLRFVAQQPELVQRLTQYHIASHLGITPTQLSRIRKKI